MQLRSFSLYPSKEETCLNSININHTNEMYESARKKIKKHSNEGPRQNEVFKLEAADNISYIHNN